MRLAGLTIIHPHVQPEFIGQVISELAARVDALFVLANGDPPPEAIRAAQSCRNLAVYAKTRVSYDRATGISDGRTLHEQAFALLDDAKPEMVLFPDADELLPPNVKEIIGLMDGVCTAEAQSAQRTNSVFDSVAKDAVLRDLRASAVKNGPAKCVEFPALVCVGDPDHVISDASIHAQWHGPHVKLCVWRPGIKLDSKRGFNYPGDDYVGHGVRSPWPLRHLYVATPAAWRERYAVKPQPWMVQPWKVVQYDPKRTWDSWLSAQAEPAPAKPADLNPKWAAILRDEIPRAGNMQGHLQFLFDDLVRRDAKRIVELGMDLGRSTVALLCAAHATEGVVVSVDINRLPGTEARIRAAGLGERWAVVTQDDLLYAKVLAQLGERPDALLIDSSHDRDHTERELRAFAPLMSERGVIYMHDTEDFYGPAVRGALNAWLPGSGWKIVQDFKHSYGLTVLEKSR